MTQSAALPLAAIVLAAGKGTRMKSDTHKVLHPIGGKPMIDHVLDSVTSLGATRIVVVVGDRKEQLDTALAGRASVTTALQEPQLGTGHAVMAARDAMAGFSGVVLILYGDVPLVRPETLQAMLERLQAPLGGTEPVAVVLGFEAADPGVYGRILLDQTGAIDRMVEFKDASAAERAVRLCNAGLMAVQAAHLFPLLDRVTNDNVAGEYYLPDIVMLARAQGLPTAVVTTDEAEVAGVNSRVELAALEAQFQSARRREAMLAGVTLVAPETVFFSHDTRLGRDVVVEPNVVFGPNVVVEDGAAIHAFSHLEGCRVATGASVGPFARLRPGADLRAGAKVGNFVEIKAAVLHDGAKVSHLTYIGDAEIGADANIGAGTITCNYDGFLKYKTTVGAGAFIGSNSALVAPVTVGDGAIVGAGSVVVRDVAADALYLGRGEPAEKPGWAARFRAARQAKKAAKLKG